MKEEDYSTPVSSIQTPVNTTRTATRKVIVGGKLAIHMDIKFAPKETNSHVLSSFGTVASHIMSGKTSSVPVKVGSQTTKSKVCLHENLSNDASTTN